MRWIGIRSTRTCWTGWKNACEAKKENGKVAVYTVTKSYHTKGEMGLIAVTRYFQTAADAACRDTHIRSVTIT